MSDAVAVQPYRIIEREAGGQVKITVQHDMILYPDYIQTHAHAFPIADVYDISCRRLGGNDAILYLHTNQGVFPYKINIDPRLFIAAFHAQKQRQ